MHQRQGTFGAVLRAHRALARLTQRELAERSGLSLRAIRYLEQDRVTRPRRASVHRLAAAMGLPAETAVSWENGEYRLPPDRLVIQILGPLSVTRDGKPVDPGPAKQRSLFALLALRANQVVSRDEIIDVLWGDRPPASCLNLVHTYVSGLRKVLEPGRRSGFSPLISSYPGGYRMTAEHLDLHRFDDLVSQARDSGSPALFDQAMRCWRGPVLADLPENLRRHPAASAAAGRRLAAALAFADVALMAGRSGMVVEHLRALVELEPLHEALCARLVLALAASGQQAMALKLFGETRSRLDEELGVTPGPELRAAHLRVVRDELVPTPGPAVPVPAELPADIGGFVGRAAEIRLLDESLHGAISVITGPPGIGKTALAVRWSQRALRHFPDGCLYVDLHGFSAGEPLLPKEVLARFLRALGVPGARVPEGLDEAAGLFRTRVANRRMLLVLDNALDAAQVRPLLPGTSGCLVLTTSRDSLAELVVREGATRVALDVLSPEQARQLVPDPAAEICAGLPLALRIAASRGEVSCLDDLVIGSESVRAAFDHSYARLSDAERRLLTSLAGFAGDFGPVTDGAARPVFDRLVSAGLVTRGETGGHRMHPLLREYARNP